MRGRMLMPLSRKVGYVLLIAGIVGFIASMMLAIETMRFYEDPSYTPLCSLNPVLSCKSIMTTTQASVIGFSNSLIGIGAFAALAAVGAALLAGARLARWYWYLLLAGAGGGVLFIHWLIFQSLYLIGSLCPYCVLVWIVTIPVFWYVFLHMASQGWLGQRLIKSRVMAWLLTHHLDALMVWYVIISGLVIVRFWYYFSTLL